MGKSVFWCGVFFILFGISNQAHAFGGKGTPKVNLTSVHTTFTEATFYGTGCNNETASFFPSPDGGEITLSYDEMIVEAGEGTNRNYHKKECRAILPVTAPPGMQLVITMGDFRGAATIPNVIGAFGRLSTRMHLQDAKRMNSGSIINKNFTRGFDDSYVHSREWVLTTGCGGSMNLIIDQKIETYAGNNGDYSTVALDSTDASNPETPRTIRVSKKKC